KYFVPIIHILQGCGAELRLTGPRARVAQARAVGMWLDDYNLRHNAHSHRRMDAVQADIQLWQQTYWLANGIRLSNQRYLFHTATASSPGLSLGRMAAVA